MDLEKEKVDNDIKITDEFDGVFRFSNNSDEDFVALWNNKEYTFPARTRSPMIIQNESLENIQEIRKRFAYKWAEREWFKSEEYQRMSKLGNGLPPTRQDAVLEPLIQQCLDPLPLSKATVKEGKQRNDTFKATKAVSQDDNLNQAFAKETQDENLMKVGTMPNKEL